MSEDYRYIILAPDYEPSSGGSMVLHRLCHVLNEMGVEAQLWPWRRKIRFDGWRRRLRTWRLSIKEQFRGPPIKTNPAWNTPVARCRMPGSRDIVVYPEIVEGNPLDAQNVVRWLLHRPGFFTGQANYGQAELYYKFIDHFDDGSGPWAGAPRLFLFTLVDDYLQPLPEGPRSGECFLVRKGRDFVPVHDTERAIQIDGLPHAEVARIFRQSAVFYSYDEVTMYSQYAALCGCLSVVVPSSYPNRDAWVSQCPLGRYGIAYGLDDLAHARETQGQVRDFLAAREQEGIESVRRFVVSSRAHFAANGPR